MTGIHTTRMLTFIAMYLKRYGVPPSYAEIAGAVHVSVTTVHYQLKALERDGKIIHQPRKHRSLELAG